MWIRGIYITNNKNINLKENIMKNSENIKTLGITNDCGLPPSHKSQFIHHIKPKFWGIITITVDINRV